MCQKKLRDSAWQTGRLFGAFGDCRWTLTFITSIQLRLADGTRLVSRFNNHHTVRDVRGFIDASRPNGSREYQLLTMGFPPKRLTELDQTIEQAGISNSVVIQKF
ncbi:hypothetical protein F2Q69_00056692 [Brassica cretica]|uniref:UBX domain-containing protein n=1 Tax=Brassica cretica TaxID=69181 RepID=A0A8S9N1G4_BRACR|nr:hypothetical protein F2Q69_00056692 [Brassica cretica]